MFAALRKKLLAQTEESRVVTQQENEGKSHKSKLNQGENQKKTKKKKRKKKGASVQDASTNELPPFKKKRDSESIKAAVAVTPRTTERSFHITQIPFAARKAQIAQFFRDAGCSVDSCRSVIRGGKFIGVAFIDVADAASAEHALALNQATFMGRKINVRPTRSRTQLKQIVEERKRRGKMQHSGAAPKSSTTTPSTKWKTGGAKTACKQDKGKLKGIEGGNGEDIKCDGELLSCRDCKDKFCYTVGEQAFAREKGWTSKPSRCKPCRQVRKDGLAKKESIGSDRPKLTKRQRAKRAAMVRRKAHR